MKKMDDFQKKNKSLYSEKKGNKILNFDEENFRYKVANLDLESDFFYALHGRIIHAISMQEKAIDLLAIYDQKIVDKNRYKLGCEVYKHVFACRNKFVRKLKNKLNFESFVKYLKGYNYYSNANALISFYEGCIVEQFFCFLVRMELIISAEKEKQNLEDEGIFLKNYLASNLDKLQDCYVDSVEFDGEFHFNESCFFEKTSILRINELSKDGDLTEMEYFDLYSKELEFLQFQKDQMKEYFPEKLKEKLFELETGFKKIVENNGENEKLIKDCYNALRSAKFIDSSFQLFYNFIRNKNGVINWTRNKNELLFFIQTLNRITNFVGNEPIYKFLCLHFTIDGKKIIYNPNLRNSFNKYVESPPKKNNQVFIKDALMILENIKWIYK